MACRLPTLLAVSFLIFGAGNLQAEYRVKDGTVTNAKDVAEKSVQEHYSLGMQALQEQQWHEVVKQFRKVVGSFPGTSFAKDGLYYLGVGYYHVGDYDLANQRLSEYLKVNSSSKHFEDALNYKLAIAERFREGHGRHLFGVEGLPRWLPAKSQALEIYDEVVATLPGHELAAQALFAKAQLLVQWKDYQEAIETYQTLTQRFPKHELVPEAYEQIAEVLYVQCSYQANNPDLLPRAEINLRRFKNHLPRDERYERLQAKMQEMRELHANGLFETGQFYERKKKPRASVIYYVTAIRRFPDTQIAEQCRDRLKSLDKYVDELKLHEEML